MFLGPWRFDEATYCFYDPWRFLPLSCSNWASALKFSPRRRPTGHPRGVPRNQEIDNYGYDRRTHSGNSPYSFANSGHRGERDYGDPWAGMSFDHLPGCIVSDRADCTVRGYWVDENNAAGAEAAEWNQQLLVGPIEDPRFENAEPSEPLGIEHAMAGDDHVGDDIGAFTQSVQAFAAPQVVVGQVAPEDVAQYVPPVDEGDVQVPMIPPAPAPVMLAPTPAPQVDNDVALPAVPPAVLDNAQPH